MEKDKIFSYTSFAQKVMADFWTLYLCIKLKDMFENFPQLYPAIHYAYVDRSLMSFPTKAFLKLAYLHKKAKYSVLQALL